MISVDLGVQTKPLTKHTREHLMAIIKNKCIHVMRPDLDTSHSRMLISRCFKEGLAMIQGVPCTTPVGPQPVSSEAFVELV